MSDYSFEVYLGRVTCRDTESIHSSDKFALSGAVITDVDTSGFVMPMMRINNGESRTFPDDLAKVFSGSSNLPKVGLVLRAWDLDENDTWVENKEDILKVSSAIAEGVKQIPEYGEVIGAVLDGAQTVIPPVIDMFVSFDKNDELLNYKDWIDMPSLVAYQSSDKPVSIRFRRESSLGYSDWDYSLDILIRCTWIPALGFGGSSSAGHTDEEPRQRSNSKTWTGVWESTDAAIQAVISENGPFHLNVTVSENTRGNTVTTTTKGVTLSSLFMEMVTATPYFSNTISLADANSQPSANKFSARVVRHQSHGGRTFSREVVAGDMSIGVPPMLAEISHQVKGDYLLLNNDASLEIYNVLLDGRAISEALRYRRPSSVLLTGGKAVFGVDEMLYRKTSIG